MRKLFDFFIDRPLVTNLFTFIIIVVGLFSLSSLQKEMFPSVEFDVVLITTPYPGSSSEDVEKLVTIPIERELKSVDGIKKLNALSAEGSSIIYAEIDPDYNLKEVTDDIKTAVDAVTDLPEDAEVPVVKSLNNKLKGVIKVALSGVDYKDLREVSKKIRDYLERDKRIAIVNLDGYREDEIRVLVDPNKMNDYEVTLSEVASAIKTRNINLSAGSLEAADGDIMIRTVSEFETTSDIEEVVVRSNPSGQRVYVRDVARVIRQPAEGAVLQRVDGKEAIFLDVKIKESADIIKTTDAIKDYLVTFFEKNPEYRDVQYTYVDDLSYFVKRRLNVLTDNGIVGLILVFGCLLLFLNFSSSVVTTMGAPIAFLISFIVMQFMGVSFNLISMFGLILVLGMLVDDSIIVAEHFYQKLEDGVEPKLAARESAYETIKPVTTTIVTTMIAFGALFFMGGIMGKFLWPVPAAVLICLAASLIECFFILPSHLADFVRLPKKKQGKRWYQPLLVAYRKSLFKALRAPALVFFGFFAIFIGSIFLASTMKFELFPGDDVRTVFVQLKGQVGLTLEETDKTMIEVEKFVEKQLVEGEYDHFKTMVGQMQGDQGIKTGAHYGSIVLYLKDPAERDRSTDEIIKAVTGGLDKVAPGYDVTVKKQEGGPPKGKPVEIELTSDSLETLKIVSKQVQELLKKEKGVINTEIDFEEGKKQFVVRVNEAEVKRLGVSTQLIALELRRGFAADELTQIRESEEDIKIRVVLDDEFRKERGILDKLYITNNSGNRIPMSRLISVEEEPGAFVIRRQDRKRIFSVSGVLDKEKNTPRGIVKTMSPKLKELMKSYPNVDFYFGGENQDTKESMQGLMKSFMIAMLSIFFVLVLMFGSLAQPIIVMLAIPLGTIGVVFAFFVFGKSLSFMAMMGVVGLVGVVINDSIVLVNFINETRKKEDNLVKAIAIASMSRFRPVILTTFTTVAGLLPVAHAVGGDPFIKPMALSFAWGLLIATFVTLIFIPCTYLLFERVKDWGVRVFYPIGHAIMNFFRKLNGLETD